MYVTISTVVEGALESEENFFDYLLVSEHLREIAEDAESSGYTIEVYALEHPHDPAEECECIQYEQSLKPVITHNPDGPASETVGHYAAV